MVWSNCGGFVAMFVDLTYLQICDNESNDEKANDDHSKKPWVVDMCMFMTPNDTSPNVEGIIVHPPPCRKCLLEWVT
jgi:hypothetical protein